MNAGIKHSGQGPKVLRPGAELKARVLLKALQGQKTAAQICRENGIAVELNTRLAKKIS